MGHLISVLRLVVVLAFGFLLANCTSNPGQVNSTASSTTEAAEQSNANAVEEPGPGSTPATSNVVSANYHISPRDILDISVFQVADLTKTVQVSDDGNISLPLIGNIVVRDKTTHEAEEIIADKLRKNYLRSPQVSVFVKQYGQRVTVSGEVKSPRVLTVDGRVTLAQAIANAGGLSDLADTKRVHVARSVNQRIDDTVYDFDAIQAGKAADPTLQGGDLVVAEQSGARVTLKNVKDLLPFALLTSLL